MCGLNINRTFTVLRNKEMFNFRSVVGMVWWLKHTRKMPLNSLMVYSDILLLAIVFQLLCLNDIRTYVKLRQYWTIKLEQRLKCMAWKNLQATVGLKHIVITKSLIYQLNRILLIIVTLSCSGVNTGLGHHWVWCWAKPKGMCWTKHSSALPTIVYYRGFPFSSIVFLHCCLRLFIIPWSIDTCKIVYFYWQRLLLFSHFQGRSTGHRGTALVPLCPATSHPSLADVLKSLAKVTEVFVGDQFFQNSRLSELLVWSLCFLILFLCRCQRTCNNTLYRGALHV